MTEASRFEEGLNKRQPLRPKKLIQVVHNDKRHRKANPLVYVKMTGNLQRQYQDV
jgi:hypothetical protein